MRWIVMPVLILCSSTVAAQQNALYFPDNVASAGTCNVIPFGDTNPASATWSNQKYQNLFTPAQLGAVPFVIQELGFAPCGGGARQFSTIKIQMSLTPATTLSTTFAANLPAPLTVLDTTNYVWANTANVWNRIGLQTPFVYDGVNSVVVDLEVTGAGMPGGTNGMHRGTLTRLYATSWVGSPPATGTLGAAAAKIELCLDVADLALFGTGCTGSNNLVPSLTLSGTGQLNSVVNIDLANALPSTAAVALIGFNNSSFRGILPLPFDLSAIGGGVGCRLYVDAPIITSVITDGTGAGSLPLGIPADQALLGARVYAQYLPVDLAASTLGVTASNYGRILIGS